MDSKSRRIGADGVMAGVALLIGVYVLASTLQLIIVSWSPVPVHDQWDNLITGRALTWRWLFSQNYGVDHRLVFPRLIFILDYWLARETNWVNFAASPIIQAGLVLLMVRVARAAGLRSRVQTLWVVGMTLALLFWSAHQENFTWGFQHQFFLVLLAAVGAFSVLALGPPTPRTLALTIVLETVAVFTMANGVLVPMFSLALAFWLGRRRQLPILAAAAVALIGLYSIHLAATSFRVRLHEVPHLFGDMLAFITAQLGAPFGLTLGWLFPVPPLGAAVACGVVGLVAFAGIGVHVLRRRDLPAPVLVLFFTACFIVATSVLMCVGRVKYAGPSYALVGRYATPALLFWLALFLLIGVRFGVRRAMVATSPALLLVLLGQPHFAAVGARAAEGRRLTAAVVAANVNDYHLLVEIYQLDETTPLREQARLRAARTSLFAAPWLSWSGSLADHARIAGSPCQGSFEIAREIAHEQHPGWRVIGRARDTARIVLADSTGVVVGYAIGRLHADAAEQPRAAGEPDGDWWVGAIGPVDAGRVTGFALSRDGATACPLGRPRRVLAAPKLVLSAAVPTGLPVAGFVDSATIASTRVVLGGWGMLQQEEGTRQVFVDTNLPVKGGKLSTPMRSDVAAAKRDPRLLFSGIALTLELDPSKPAPALPRLCLWTADPVFGRARLQMAARPELCPP